MEMMVTKMLRLQNYCSVCVCTIWFCACKNCVRDNCNDCSKIGWYFEGIRPINKRHWTVIARPLEHIGHFTDGFVRADRFSPPLDTSNRKEIGRILFLFIENQMESLREADYDEDDENEDDGKELPRGKL